MTAEVRRLLVAATVAAALAFVHGVSARLLAAHDLLGALLNQFDAVTLLLGVVTAFTRIVLVFLVPGWLVYRLLRVVLANARSTAR